MNMAMIVLKMQDVPVCKKEMIKALHTTNVQIVSLVKMVQNVKVEPYCVTKDFVPGLFVQNMLSHHANAKMPKKNAMPVVLRMEFVARLIKLIR